MVTFLHLCFPWTFVVALVLVTVIAFMDLIYSDVQTVPCYYPGHPRVQIAILLMIAAIFVLWQLPLSSESEYAVEILLARFAIILVWFFCSRFLVKWLIYGIVFLAIHSFIRKVEKHLSV